MAEINLMQYVISGNEKIAVHEFWMGWRRKYHKCKEGHRPKLTHEEVQDLIYEFKVHLKKGTNRQTKPSEPKIKKARIWKKGYYKRTKNGKEWVPGKFIEKDANYFPKFKF